MMVWQDDLAGFERQAFGHAKIITHVQQTSDITIADLFLAATQRGILTASVLLH